MFTSHLVTSFNPIRYLTRIKPNRETGGTEVGPYGSSTYAPLKCAPPAFQSLSFTQFYLKTTNLIITFNIWWSLKHLCALGFQYLVHVVWFWCGLANRSYSIWGVSCGGHPTPNQRLPPRAQPPLGGCLRNPHGGRGVMGGWREGNLKLQPSAFHTPNPIKNFQPSGTTLSRKFSAMVTLGARHPRHCIESRVSFSGCDICITGLSWG